VAGGHTRGCAQAPPATSPACRVNPRTATKPHLPEPGVSPILRRGRSLHAATRPRAGQRRGAHVGCAAARTFGEDVCVARRTIDGRTALDRSGVAAHLGVAYTTVNNWHRHRTRFTFPDGFTHDGGEWFWLDDIDRFHTAHLAAKRAELTKVDRRGQPDDLVGSGAAARILGYRSYRNLPDTLYDRPDRIERLPDGRVRRLWFRRTVWAVADARTGRQSTGRTPGTTGARKPHPYADDPRLQVAVELLNEAGTGEQSPRGLGVELARRLRVGERTAQRLLTQARLVADGPQDNPPQATAPPIATGGATPVAHTRTARSGRLPEQPGARP